MFQSHVQPTSDQKCVKQTLHRQENVKIKEVLCAYHAETFTLTWAPQWYNLSQGIFREQLKRLGGFVQDMCKYCAARHKKLERLQVWIFWNQPWRSTRDEGVLFLSLYLVSFPQTERVFSSKPWSYTCGSSWVRSHLQMCLPLHFGTLYCLLSFLPSTLSHFWNKLVCLYSIRVVVHYSHSQKQNHVWDQHFHLNFKSVNSS